ncbi:MAG TPA: DUF4350 domain-containing protein [Fimbriimonadaceae bacterium]|nr:DUF4350 domain-containing protein [Fimbriimonadaceae bacterium]
MRGWSVWKVTGLLVAVLLVASILLKFGEQRATAFPSITSYEPSGLRAFAELLQSEGYQVERTRSVYPKVDANTLVIVPVAATPTSWDTTPEFIMREDLTEALREAGAPNILLTVPREFRTAIKSVTGVITATSPADGSEFEVTDATAVSDTVSFEDLDVVPLWSLGDVGIFLSDGDEALLEYTLPMGLLAVNAYIDHLDNAEFLMRAVRAAAGPEIKKVVFCEAMIAGADDDTLLAALGGWATGAWTQVLVLALVIVFTLGKRFGLPDEHRLKQRGARELVDAISGTLNRSQATGIALDAIASDADREIRKALKLPRDAPAELRNEQLPGPLLNALQHVEERRGTRMDPGFALKLIQRLEAELRAFIASRSALR